MVEEAELEVEPEREPVPPPPAEFRGMTRALIAKVRANTPAIIMATEKLGFDPLAARNDEGRTLRKENVQEVMRIWNLARASTYGHHQEHGKPILTYAVKRWSLWCVWLTITDRRFDTWHEDQIEPSLDLMLSRLSFVGREATITLEYMNLIAVCEHACSRFFQRALAVPGRPTDDRETDLLVSLWEDLLPAYPRLANTLAPNEKFEVRAANGGHWLGDARQSIIVGRKARRPVDSLNIRTFF